jgi:trigger factor
MMEFRIEELSPVEKRLAVEIPWERVREKLDIAYRELGKGAQIRGFRKGKVPRSVLERMYGKAVQQEVAKELVQESFLKAAGEHKLEPVAEPTIEEATLKTGESFKYSAKVEVRAAVELKEIDGLPGTRRKVVVPDAEVDKALDHKRTMHTEFKPIEGRTTTATTDVLIITCKGTIGEHKVDRPEVSVDLSEPKHEPLPGLAAALTGVPIDAKDLEINLDMPADSNVKEIAGQKAALVISIKDAREKVIPALDDEFAKDTGEADTLDELRGKLREGLEKAARDRADRDAREVILKELIKRNPVPVANALVERGIDNQIKRARISLAMQGLDMDQAGVDMDGMRERLRDGAADEIRGQLLLEEIADKEKIEISDGELDAKIAELAASQQKRPQKVRADMEREGTLDTLRWRLRQDKALDLVLSRATITEIEGAPDATDADAASSDVDDAGADAPPST